MDTTGWVTLVPGEQDFAALRAELSALADHPGHVRTAGGRDELLVPPYVAQKYAPAPKRRRIKQEEGEE